MKGSDKMEILLIRHGQSLADLEDRHEGRADYPLTELGHSQAEKLSTWLANQYDIELVISSPLIRASSTAEYIAKETGSKLIITNVNISSGDTGVHFIDIKQNSIRILFTNKQEHLL